MLDGHEAQAWADHHHEWTGWVTAAVAALYATSRRLVAMNYDAPWLGSGACPSAGQGAGGSPEHR